MSSWHEIDYQALVNRSIKDFQPVKRLWPAGVRLFGWIVLEGAILALASWLQGYDNVRALLHDPGRLGTAGLFASASTIIAFLALKSAVPGRELTWLQLLVLTAIVAIACALGPTNGGTPHQTSETFATSMLRLCGLATMPWLCLFWAVRRGVTTRPEVTGGAIGLAAFCFGVASEIVTRPLRLISPPTVLIISGVALPMISALAGRFWLDWIARWEQREVSEQSTEKPATFTTAMSFPLALAASLVALLFLLRSPAQFISPIPDFDLAISSYERALVDFRPNVPSTSMETMLTAYVEHGMPAYMWDFAAEGFPLVGGRWDPLPDGTPVTYTWFKNAHGGIICLFKQTDGFNPPQIAHDERHHLLFYRYRDFSFCLIDVGGYGSFVSVIAAPMPLDRFERLVLAATL
jgi:hypothetical protein